MSATIHSVAIRTCFDCGQDKPWTEFPHFRGEHPPYRCSTCRESGLKRCVRCLQHKPIEDFSLAPRKALQRKSRCRSCVHATYDPRVQHNANVQRLYGISAEEYARHLEAQLGVCRICGSPPRGRCRLAVDHDHETNKVRGLLCGNCNNGLGRFQDNPELLRLAANYLEASS